MKVNDNFTGINITGRAVLGYIAQCAGGFAKAYTNGKIQITKFTTKSITLDNTKYKTELSLIDLLYLCPASYIF